MKKSLSIIVAGLLLTSTTAYAKKDTHKPLKDDIENNKHEIKHVKDLIKNLDKNTTSNINLINVKIDQNTNSVIGLISKDENLTYEIRNHTHKSTYTELESADKDLTFTGNIAVGLWQNSGKNNNVEYTNNPNGLISTNLTGLYNIDNKTKVTGTVSMFKNFGNNTPTNSIQNGYNISDNSIYLSELFIRHDFNSINSWINAGIISATDHMNVFDIRNQDKTFYPRAMLNQTIEGLEVGKSFESITSGDTTILNKPEIKVIGFQIAENNTGINSNAVSLEDTNVASAIISTGIGSNIGKNFLSIGYMHASEVTDSDFNENIGSWNLSNIDFTHKDAFGTGLSYNLSYSICNTEANGNTVNGKTMTNGWGDMILVGMSYKIKDFTIGGEYNKGQGNFFNLNTSNINDMFNKLNTVGSAYGFNASYQIDKINTLKINGVFINPNVVRSGVLNDAIITQNGSYDKQGFSLSLNAKF
jgi:hypothetical protein